MGEVADFIQKLMGIQEIETLVKLILIVILSGIVGSERESWNKPAGFRTHVLVGISAVLVMICGEYLHLKTGADSSRIPAQLLSGIGFLGAGTILRDGFNVRGLTTAAGLLAVTCIGLAVGAGYYLGAIIATAVVYCVLSYSHMLSGKTERTNTLELQIFVNNPRKILEKVNTIMKEHNLEILKIKIVDLDDENEYIKVLLKHQGENKTNEIISQIMEIDKVKEVIEI